MPYHFHPWWDVHGIWHLCHHVPAIILLSRGRSFFPLSFYISYNLLSRVPASLYTSIWFFYFLRFCCCCFLTFSLVESHQTSFTSFSSVSCVHQSVYKLQWFYELPCWQYVQYCSCNCIMGLNKRTHFIYFYCSFCYAQHILSTSPY